MASRYKSIVQQQFECAICGCRRKDRLNFHHIFGGCNRRLSDEDHLTCWLCFDCHRELHDGKLKQYDKDLKATAQMRWMKEYGKTQEEWIARYSKNYIE